MRRRTWLSSTLLALLALRPASAHTPYRQWDVFRKRHLQILTSRTDLVGDAIGDQWVARLREQLPLSRALVSRARDVARIASLLKTDQGKLAILSYADAHAVFSGKPPFAEYAPIPLQLLLDRGTHLLVTREDLPMHHGYLIVSTLLEDASALTLEIPPQGRLGMALHAGAKAVMTGEKLEMPEPS